MILAIYCAGGLGKEVLEFARSISRWDEILFVDDVTDATECHGARVLRFPDVAALDGDVEFVIASGEPAGRKALYERVKAAGYRFATLISPYATISSGVQIGEGCIILDVGLSVDVQICENVLVNGRAIMGHDVKIGAHSVVSANCFLGGKTVLEQCVYLAPGSMVKDRIVIRERAIISLGTVILRNVKPRAIMLGNPAKQIGENTENKVFGMFS